MSRGLVGMVLLLLFGASEMGCDGTLKETPPLPVVDTGVQDGSGTNGCGGEGELSFGVGEAQPGGECGLCEDGVLICTGPDALACAAPSPPNSCGGCGLLEGAPGATCGLCDDGQWSCGGGTVSCIGESQSNSCGGCEPLATAPGELCGLATGDEGLTICVGRTSTACVSLGRNLCGGAGALTLPEGITGVEARPGVRYDDGCRAGVLYCEGDALAALAVRVPNGCGGCVPLLGEPGTSCNACGAAWTCVEDLSVSCVGPKVNVCGGCTELPSPLGAACGTEGGRVSCVGADLLGCTTPGVTNACGGLASLAGDPLGAACGDCLDGTVVCDLSDAARGRTVCAAATAPNACGGCATLEAPPGGRCGTCGTGTLACGGAGGGVVCDGDLGEAAKNLCGGCGALNVEVGIACGRCGTTACDGSLLGQIRCVEPAAGCQVAAVCGNGAVEAGEGCDDGNQVTEACAYGLQSCSVCGAACQALAGATAYCGDGLLDAVEVCDAGSANGTGGCSGTCECATEYHLESGACVSDTRACTVANATAATETWTGSAYGACTATACDASYHIESGACVSDTRSCSSANATVATQTWNSGTSSYGTCTASACASTYHIESGACVSDTRSCSSANATAATETWTGSAYGSCTASACSASYHVESGACVSDTRSCTVANATAATETWNSGTSSYGSCTASACSASYHIESGACVSDTRSCSIANGTGSQTYASGSWGTCSVVICDSAFHIESGACVSDTRSCSSANATAATETWNSGTSSYGSCTASACSASYHVESGACVSDTRSCTVANATAATETWTGSAYGSCTASACSASYHIESGACVSDTRSCSSANATAATETWTGSAYGSCTASACSASYHIESGACVSDTRNCSITNGSGSQTYASGSWGTCSVASCDSAFHIESGACVSDTRSCSGANATAATETWTGSAYGGCTATACASGYGVNAGACVLQSPLGTACTLDAACASGFCATGPDGTANDRCAPTGMNYIPSGTFIMGSPSGEVGRFTDETQHSVNLSRGFFLGQTEVTQGQWKALSGGINPSCFQSATGTACTTSNANDSGPVEKMDWYSAVGFANARSAAEGLTVCYTLTGCTDATDGWKDGILSGCTGATLSALTCAGYRLPTESEWEYAARAGTTTATYLGNLSGGVSNCTTAQANLDGIAWWCINAGSRTQAVGSKAANSFGLYDMLGTVWEWTGDWYDASYPGTVTDPLGAATGTLRVTRGGSWSNFAYFPRAAYRRNDAPVDRFNILGFRLSRTVPSACATSFHIESDACVSDTRSCAASNATAATETWTGSAYGLCTISSCSAGFALVSNSCVGGCGNGVIGSGESCDDGNTVTEQCAYGELSCSVCNASCQSVAGETDFCTDGTLDPAEFCDDGNTSNADSCNNSCACSTGYHAQGGICANDVQACTINNGTATENWNGSSYGLCTLTACNSGYHQSGNACDADVISCSTANATAATQTWNAGTGLYGVCTATACASTYHVEAGVCVSDTRACSPLPSNTTAGMQTWDGVSAYGSCTATTCSSGYHVEFGLCASDTRSCSVTNGTGSQTYASGAWGTCTAASCNSTYHEESNACLSDTRSCSPMPANATAGTQTYASGAWGSCTISACSGGYNLTSNSCVISATANNILVERVGDGTTTLGSSGAAVSLLEFTPVGVAVGSAYTFPTAAVSNRLIDSGTAGNQGFFGARNGIVVVAGYDAPIPTTSLTTATGVNRVANVFNGDLTIANSTRLTFGDVTVVASSNLRSIVPLTASTGYIGTNGSFAVASNGVSYYSGSTLTPISGSNRRNVEVYDGQLYYSDGTSAQGIYKLGTGLPTSTATGTLMFAVTTPYGFVIFDTNTDGTPDLAYVCDDGPAANGGGLKKLTYAAGSWTNAWTLRTAAAPSTALAAANANACTGLTGSYASGTATLYFTENTTMYTNNRVLQVIDAGTQPNSSTTIATAGANYSFRGVDLKGF